MGRSYKRLSALLMGLLTMVCFSGWQAAALRLPERSLTLSDNNPNITSRYDVAFSYETTSMLGSISIEFCVDDPIAESTCVAPSGLDVSQAIIVQQTGETGFSISPQSTANQLLFTRSPQIRSITGQRFELSNVINPSAEGTYYVKLRTFASSDGSGTMTDFGGIAYSINRSITVRAEVPPYLIFCAAKTISGINCTNIDGSTVDFGEFSSRIVNSATSQFQVTANAASGYNVRIAGPTLASGNDIINALGSNDSSRPGTSQFGLNLRANSQPAIGRESQGGTQGQPMLAYGAANSYRFVPGEVIVSAQRNDASELFTVSYIVNIPSGQPAGIYVTTLTYICLANF